MSFYLAHKVGEEPTNNNMKYIIKFDNNINDKNYIKTFGLHLNLDNNTVLCLHEKIDILENKFNDEMVSICYNDNQYDFKIFRFHDEKAEFSVYDRVN